MSLGWGLGAGPSRQLMRLTTTLAPRLALGRKFDAAPYAGANHRHLIQATLHSPTTLL